MLRIIVRIIILLCLFTGPVVAIACAKKTTTVETDEQVIERRSETIVTGD